MNRLRVLLCVLIISISVVLSTDTYSQANDNVLLPSLNFGIESSSDPTDIALTLQVLLLLTVLSLAPAIVMMTTSFLRIAIVFSFARTALALQQMPPNQVIMALALFLTFFIMAPSFNEIYENAYKPFKNKEIGVEELFDRGIEPIRQFMFKQIGEEDRQILVPFIQMSKLKWPEEEADVPTYVLIPAFMLNELKKAFYMGIIIFVPFIIIDMIVASILMSMGMIMLPPVMISLPFKIILFVLVDGWQLLVSKLLESFV